MLLGMALGGMHTSLVTDKDYHSTGRLKVIL
jgi:hypothetical protein